jgi:hypothetical protein
MRRVDTDKLVLGRKLERSETGAREGWRCRVGQQVEGGRGRKRRRKKKGEGGRTSEGWWCCGSNGVVTSREGRICVRACGAKWSPEHEKGRERRTRMSGER